MSRVPWSDGVEVAPGQRLRHKADGALASIAWLYDSPTAYVQFYDRRYGSYPFDKLIEAFERLPLRCVGCNADWPSGANRCAECGCELPPVPKSSQSDARGEVMSAEYERGRVAGYEEAAKDTTKLVQRLSRHEAALREIAAGFLPDGTYAGRPIYEIAAQADGGVEHE